MDKDFYYKLDDVLDSVSKIELMVLGSFKMADENTLTKRAKENVLCSFIDVEEQIETLLSELKQDNN